MIDARYEQAIHGRGSCYLCDCSSHAPVAIGAWMGRHHCWHRNPDVGERSRFSDSWRSSGRALAQEELAFEFFHATFDFVIEHPFAHDVTRRLSVTG